MTGTAEISLKTPDSGQNTLQGVHLTYTAQDRVGVLWRRELDGAEPRELLTVECATCDVLEDGRMEVLLEGFVRDQEDGRYSSCRVRFVPDEGGG